MGFVNQPLTNEAARKLMALDVQDKEILTYEKLDEWYTAWGGQCYVSFSGGKDSTVLAYLAAWNLLWAIEMRCKKPECVDTPWREEKA